MMLLLNIVWFASCVCTVDSFMYCLFIVFFFVLFKQKTAYEMRISDWSSDVCSSDLTRSLRQICRSGNAALAALDPENEGSAAMTAPAPSRQIGRASCRERVCQYV